MADAGVAERVNPSASRHPEADRTRAMRRPEAVVQITGIAAGGEGVGRLPDGRAVFVHRTAPGERVSVRVIEERRRWARAEALRILEPAPERRPAPRPHYARCGGSTLEHLEYEAQLRPQSHIVAEPPRRTGGLEAEPPAVVASPPQV